MHSDCEVYTRHRGMKTVGGKDQHRVVDETVQRRGSYLQEDNVPLLSSGKDGVLLNDGSGWI
jgi:hypothetical protein